MDEPRGRRADIHSKARAKSRGQRQKERDKADATRDAEHEEQLLKSVRSRSWDPRGRPSRSRALTTTIQQRPRGYAAAGGKRRALGEAARSVGGTGPYGPKPKGPKLKINPTTGKPIPFGFIRLSNGQIVRDMPKHKRRRSAPKRGRR